jgi:DUF1680 family protein
LPGYFFTTSQEGVWVHLYDACEALITLPDRTVVRLEMRTRYPWEGQVEMLVTPAAAAEFTLFLRIPGWAEGASVTINGEESSSAAPVMPGSYLALRRRWAPGDVVRLELPLPVRPVESHPRVTENRGAVALTRGPLVYCLESPDNVTAAIPDLALALASGDASGGFCAEWQPLLLGGVTLLRGPGRAVCAACTAGQPDPLYRPWGEPTAPRYDQPAAAIPYYAWANRESSAMTVWAPVAPDGAVAGVACTLAEHHGKEHGH